MRSCIRDMHSSLLKQDITVTQLFNQTFSRMEETKNLNAFITTCEDQAYKEAQSLDKELQEIRNKPSINKVPPLFGLPISIKDNFCTNDLLTTCGSKMLHNFVPNYDATVVTRLKKANCVIIGKTNMDEFAMGSSCTTSHFKAAANFHKSHLLEGKRPNECDPNKWFMAGGSSTGSAISVASGTCYASIGTDTGGSVRQPASLLGVVGFKPTYGLISRFGLIPLVHCLDVVSILSKNVDGIGAIFNQVVGMDKKDQTSVDHERLLKQIPRPENLENQTIRVGVPEEFISNGGLADTVDTRFSDLVRRLSRSHIGCVKFEPVSIKLPHASLATECYTIVSSAEIASNMSCYDGVKYGYSTQTKNETMLKKFDRDEFFRANRDAGFGLEVKKRILLGNYFLLSENRDRYLVQAQKLRRLIRDDFKNMFFQKKLDVILMPSTPTTAISHAQWLAKKDENKLFGEDYFLIPTNLANLPSISLPAGLSHEGLPIGVQLISDKFRDIDLLRISKFLEENLLSVEFS